MNGVTSGNEFKVLCSEAEGCLADWLVFESMEQYEQFCRDNEETLRARWMCGKELGLLTRGKEALAGYCTVCEKPAKFSIPRTDGTEPNLREELTCSGCGLNARLRATLHALIALHKRLDRIDLYVTEQASPMYRWLKKRYSRVIGSEYFDEEVALKLKTYLEHLLRSRELLKFEDVTRLSMADSSFDAVISCDVLEHVPNYRQALAEFARVLRRGGHLILTVPFMDRDYETIVRAGIDRQGKIEHYLPPEYHGDPVHPDGVLAFYNFGWDLVESLREAGFRKVAWCLTWSFGAGLLGPLWILIGRK